MVTGPPRSLRSDWSVGEPLAPPPPPGLLCCKLLHPLHRDRLLLPLQALPPLICCCCYFFTIIIIIVIIIYFSLSFFLHFLCVFFVSLFCDTCRVARSCALCRPLLSSLPRHPLPLLQPNVERGNLVGSVVCAAFTPTVCRTLKVKKDHSAACG